MSNDSKRKGPTQSATLYKIGTKKTGNDGNKWIITETSNGVKRWKLYKKKSKTTITKHRSKSITSRRKSKFDSAKLKNKLSKLGKNTKSFIYKEKLGSKYKKYEIHDNGGRPFAVLVNKNELNVYTYEDDDDWDWQKGDPPKNILLLTIKKFIGYWPGVDTSVYTSYNGNSVLVQETKTQYVSIGSVIQRFETSEEILDYVSPIGNSDVPYPIAYSENYVYFMLDSQYIDKTYIDLEAIPKNAEEMTQQFYFNKSIPEKVKHKFKKNKILVKRKY